MILCIKYCTASKHRWTLIFSLCSFKCKSEIIADCDVGIVQHIRFYFYPRIEERIKEIESLCVSLCHIKSWSLLCDDKNQIERGKKEKKDKQRRRESERKDRKGPQSRFERSKGRKNRRKKVKAMTQKLGKRKWRVPIRFRIINHYTKVLFNFDIW